MITTRPSEFCCGITELGNFAYVKDKGPKGKAHYHRGKSGWQTVTATEPTTVEEICTALDAVTNYSGGVVCSTGADQEYLDEILPKLGFIRHDFHNRTHEKGLVKLWFLASDNYIRPVAESAASKK